MGWIDRLVGDYGPLTIIVLLGLVVLVMLLRGSRSK